MSPELTVTLVSVFLSTALLVGLFASTVLGRTAPELKRLRDVTRSSVETEGARQWLPEVVRRTRQAALSLRKSSGKNTRQSRSLIDSAAAVVLLQSALEAERAQGQPPGQLLRPNEQDRGQR